MEVTYRPPPYRRRSCATHFAASPPPAAFTAANAGAAGSEVCRLCCAYIRCPMSLKVLDCQLSKLVNSDTCPRPRQVGARLARDGVGSGEVTPGLVAPSPQPQESPTPFANPV